jgi:hypothetical protein
MTYRHYKGGRYVMLLVAETHEHNGDEDVVYLSLTTGKIVTRPYNRDSRGQDSWRDEVLWPDGIRRERFVVDMAEYTTMFASTQSGSGLVK